MPFTSKILIVDDDPAVLEALVELFCDDYETLATPSGQEAIAVARENTDLAVVIMDIKMAQMDGIVAAREIKALLPDLAVIFYTGHPGEYHEHEIDRQENPFDYLSKGKSIDALSRAVRNAVESHELRSDSKALAVMMQSDFGIVGRSAPMRGLFQTIRRAGPAANKVMILGETGTGKELVARAIHSLSGRHPLAVLNCNHKDPGHVESELFGHTKAAFSSIADRMGKVEYADGGTLFLDEIGDLDMTTQAKLLRVVEYGEYEKLGDPELRKTHIRVICATHRDLEEKVKDGTFREDLFYRLKGVTITLPPLRDRREDIPLLVNTFLERYTVRRGSWPRYFDDEAMNVLMEHDWPGNVRQLADAVESLVNSGDSEMIFADDVRAILGRAGEPSSNGAGLNARLKNYERTLILEALHRTGFNVKAAAELLDIDNSNLHKKLKAFGIDTSAYRS